MRIFVTALVVAAVIGAPAMAQQSRRQSTENNWMPPGPARLDAQGRLTDGRVHSSNPSFDVYDSSGVYAGSDPDPNVRDMLRRDNPFNPRDSR
jgi:Ni/Co efflux regulator RcnB